MPGPNPSTAESAALLTRPWTLSGTPLSQVPTLAALRVLAPSAIADYEVLLGQPIGHAVRPECRDLIGWSPAENVLVRPRTFTRAYGDHNDIRTTLDSTTIVGSIASELEFVTGDPIEGTDDFELGAGGYDGTIGAFIRLHDSVGVSRQNWDDANAVHDVVAHELGHVILDLLARYLGVDEVEDQVRSIWQRPSAPWDTGTWSGRLEESFAEHFKDTYLMDDKRKYPNRAIRLPVGQHGAFIDLIERLNDSVTHTDDGSKLSPEHIPAGDGPVEGLSGGGANTVTWRRVADVPDTVTVHGRFKAVVDDAISSPGDYNSEPTGLQAAWFNGDEDFWEVRDYNSATADELLSGGDAAFIVEDTWEIPKPSGLSGEVMLALGFEPRHFNYSYVNDADFWI